MTAAMPTQTAVIVPVAPAERVVAEHRRHLDRAASWGVPAHVTVLFPFMAPVEIDDDVVRRLATAIASVSVFDCTFARCEWFDRDVLWLAPDPAQPFRDLTDAVAREFPEHPPYGGAHDDVVPHLTVGEARFGTLDELRAAEVAVLAQLPVTARIDHALLIAGTDQPDSWSTVATLALS